MRAKAVMATLGYLLILFSLTYMVPIITGFAYDESTAFMFKTYVLPMILSMCIGIGIGFHSRSKAEVSRV